MTIVVGISWAYMTDYLKKRDWPMMALTVQYLVGLISYKEKYRVICYILNNDSSWK